MKRLTCGDLANELARIQGEIETFDGRDDDLSPLNERIQRLLSLSNRVAVQVGMMMDVSENPREV